MFQRAQEVLVEGVHLVAEHLLHLLLQLELRPLLDRVGELAERRDELEAGRDQVEVLREARIVAVWPGERRDLPREVAHERRLLDRALDELLEELLHDLARTPARLHGHAVSVGDATEVRMVERHRLADGFAHRTEDRDAPNGGVRSIVRPRTTGSRRRVGVAADDRVHGPRALGEERLAELHHRVVVAVGLVGLEHRELGVVVAIDALVAEVAPQLVHALHAPDEHPLEVQLERDAQLHRDVERMVRGERTGVRAAGHGCSIGPSNSTNPRSSSTRRIVFSTAARARKWRRGSSSAIRCR